MEQELLNALARFHREVALPDITRIVDERVDGAVSTIRNEMLTHFDGVYQRLDRLETEFQALRQG